MNSSKTMNDVSLFEDAEETDGMESRRAALAILGLILGKKKMLDEALGQEPLYTALSPRDKAFARMLVSTILRRRGQLDELIARALNKGETPRPETLKLILYIGITQILFMNVADHAAVDTSVTLTSENGMEGKKGFVNAILRRMTREGMAWVEGQDPAALNIPAWLYTQWMKDYGFAQAKDIGMASLSEAALDISLKDQTQMDEWSLKLATRKLPTGSLRRPAGGNVTELEGFEHGAWFVQDAASALPVKLFGDITGKTVLDLCCAPGGKTMQLAASGAKVVACDRSAARMKQVHENLSRLSLSDSVQTVIEDGSVWKPRDKFTHILLDAPCSATGTIRRHPDLLYLKNEKDQAGLENIQERLLENAARMLEEGGTLIYCTCSLQKAEGEHRIEKFLNNHKNFHRMPIKPEEIGGIIEAITPEGDARILPYHLSDDGGMDGFFIARMRKTSPPQ